ncbi:hypothetical protein [Arthrobacter sp. YC-RL1]|uniref:hypothetical protein n=1 Tax=Arthrobacter sp. YC-RL1 TaxID=1652545 RepID=UPI000ADD5EE7|nr:hypothetical protein [Arthrobacter sp. YC-RL1]
MKPDLSQLRSLTTEGIGLLPPDERQAALKGWLLQLTALENDGFPDEALSVALHLIGLEPQALGDQPEFVSLLSSGIRLSCLLSRGSESARLVGMLDSVLTRYPRSVTNFELRHLENYIPLSELHHFSSYSDPHHNKIANVIEHQIIDLAEDLFEETDQDIILSKISSLVAIIAQQKTEYDQINCKNLIYANVALRIPITSDSVFQIMNSLADEILHLSCWSPAMRVVNESESQYCRNRSVGLNVSDEFVGALDGTAASLSSVLIKYSTSKIGFKSSTQIAQILRNKFTSQIFLTNLPQFSSYIENVLSVLVTLGITNSDLKSLHSEDNFVELRPSNFALSLKSVARGDFQNAVVLLELTYDSEDLLRPPFEPRTMYSLVDALTNIALQNIPDSKFEFSSLSKSIELALPGTRSLLPQILLPGFCSLNVLDDLHEISFEDEDYSAISATYIRGKSCLRDIHKRYGSRNFMFITLSIALLRIESQYIPREAVKRIRSLFNLFKLVKYRNEKVLTTVNKLYISLLEKLGEEERVTEASNAFAQFSLDRNLLSEFVWARTRYLHSTANRRISGKEVIKITDATLQLVQETRLNDLPVDSQVEFRFSILRNLFAQERFQEAERLALMSSDIVAKSGNRDYVRIINTYLAVIENKLNQFSEESAAWRILEQNQADRANSFYALQASRAYVHDSDEVLRD